MIDVSVDKDSGNYISITTTGHALYDISGKDIVCAAVSVLIINTINSLERFTGVDLSIDSNQDKGYINCVINNPDDESNLLIKSMILGLTSIKDTYSSYVQINIREV